MKILSEATVADNLRLMGRKPTQKFTLDVARELCQRTGSKVVLGGSIANLGAEYVIGINAVNCLTGQSVAQEQMRANRKEEVLGELDKAASDLRRRLGESLSSIQQFYRPIQQDVSTASFEAFQAYTNGQKMVIQKGRPAAIPFFRHAVELDSKFALAYMGLGLIYGSLGETTLSGENARRAYDLRDRVSSSERLLIEVQYHMDATGQIERAIEAGQVWSQNYPRDWVPHERLGRAYQKLGQFSNALSEYQQARSHGERNPVIDAGLATTYICLDRLHDGDAVLREGLRQNPEQQFFRQGMYLVSFLSGNVRGMQDQLAWARNQPGAEDLLLSMDSDSEVYYGRLKKARELTRMASESAQHNDSVERSALERAKEALWEAEFGNVEAARRQAHAALGLAAGRDVRVLAALAFARIGDAAQARDLADRLNADFPAATLIQNYWLPAIRAEIATRAGDPERAIDLLRAAELYELSSELPLLPMYIRAQAFLRGRQGKAAAAEFQKILQYRGILSNSPVGALAELGLARAYAASGDLTNARTKYEDFVARWKDADRDIPILNDAISERAKVDAAVPSTR